MANDKTYNGWVNHETWLVALWIGNEEGSYNYWTDRTREICQSAEPTDIFTKDEAALHELSETLKDEVGELPEELRLSLKGLYLDLLNSALGEVEWRDIARHYIAVYHEDVTYQESRK